MITTTLLLIGAFSGPALQAQSGALPLVSNDIQATIAGDIAQVHVTQVFVNPNPTAIDARYTFPLPHDAAVHAMTMEVAGKLVQAKIARVEEAKATFEAAKQEGKTASLLEEHRANVFTQDVANIPAGDRVTISITYAQTVPREDGRYSFHVPLAIGERYGNGANGVSVQSLDKPLPDTKTLAAKAAIRVELRAGLPIAALESTSHRIEVDVLSSTRRRIALAAGQIPGDRDFVLKYSLAGKQPSAGLITHRDERGTFFSALIEPPLEAPHDEIFRRELVFVLDASGSMAGPPIEASKRLVREMLSVARPGDTFRIIFFGSQTDELSAEALPASAENLEKARDYLARTGGMGGTEIELGIKAALTPALPEGKVRLVMFLTDGYIGDEASVMATIHAHRKPHTTIFSFGVGNGVNRWLLEEMAIAGRGVARIVGVEEDPTAAAEALAQRLRSPLLTNLSLDWGDSSVEGVTPQPLPDLYAGAPLRVLGRFSKGGKPARATLIGWRGGQVVKIPLAIDTQGTNEAIPNLWARSQIADRMRAMTRPYAMRGKHDGGDDTLVEQITRLGLDYSITTRWTAFVAVSDNQVPRQETPPAPTFSSAPEPVEWAMMLMLAMLAAFALRRKRA